MWFGKLTKNEQATMTTCPCRRTSEIAWEKALTCKWIMRLEMRNMHVQLRTKSKSLFKFHIFHWISEIVV